MVNVPDTRGNGRYQLKPLAEPELYVAVVNGQLALKVSIKRTFRLIYISKKNIDQVSKIYGDNGSTTL